MWPHQYQVQIPLFRTFLAGTNLLGEVLHFVPSFSCGDERRHAYRVGAAIAPAPIQSGSKSMHGAATRLKDTPGNTKVSGYAQKETSVSPEQKHMLGAAAFRFSVCGRINPSSTRLYTTKVICRHPTSSVGRNVSRAWSKTWLEKFTCQPGTRGEHSQALASNFTGSSCHSSSCLLAKDGIIGATIWHALLPSSYLTVDQDKFSTRNLVQGAGTLSSLRAGAGKGIALMDGAIQLGKFDALNGRFPGTTAFKDGSWNVAWDARPARWLQGRHSAWLLFGFCSCFSVAASTGTAIACCEASAVPSPPDSERQIESPGTHGKKVFNEFSVIGIPGDGRCLFRAVAHGVCTRNGELKPNEESQRDLADELRSKVVDELVKRRAESEWFIEGDFDLYAERMREPHVWGGEPELLMLSHVLKTPITVYMSDRSSNGLIAIAEYGQEYGKENPVRVLYHGFGHYDALLMPDDSPQSKL